MERNNSRLESLLVVDSQPYRGERPIAKFSYHAVAAIVELIIEIDRVESARSITLSIRTGSRHH